MRSSHPPRRPTRYGENPHQRGALYRTAGGNGAGKAIRKSLKLPAQEPEPLAHAPALTLELIAESA